MAAHALAGQPLALEEELFWTVSGRSEIPRASEAYTRLFWRPFVGQQAFTLWDVLRSSLWWVEQKNRWPSISLLAEMMGDGADRYTILGRSACRGRAAQPGLLAELEAHRLVRHWTTGATRRSRVYHFQVRLILPLLTPAQAGTLPAGLQDYHLDYLDHAGVRVGRWSRFRQGTFVPPFLLFVGEEGVNGYTICRRHEAESARQETDRVEVVKIGEYWS